jgi:ABC-type multidrug transport system permease subunit
VTEEKRRDRIEVVATILLSVATVATAWSAYQSNRWNGEQAKATARGNAARIESTRASGVANRQLQIDVALFTQFIDAFAQEQTELANFYRARFREEFKPAFEAWVATRPRLNPDAPLTPFELPQYRLAANAEAEELEATADAFAAEARRNIQRSSNYVLGVVLFASALFFAGISTRLTMQRTRVVALGLGCAIFLGTLLWIATSPISVSV